MLTPRPSITPIYDPNPIGIKAPVVVEERSPTANEVLTSAWERDNLIGSAFSNTPLPEPDKREPGYSAWPEIQGTKYETYWQDFANEAYSQARTDALKARIDREEQNDRNIAAAGGWGTLASLGAGLFSPENLLPGGEIFRGAKLGTNVLRSAASVGIATGLATSVSETALQSSQVTRTPEQSAINIGASVLLGGMLGAGASALFSRMEWARVSKAMELEAPHAAALEPLEANERAMLDGMTNPASAGAAARQVDSLEDLTIAGKGAQIAGGAVRNLNPVLRILHSPSVVSRDIGTRLFENPVYLKKNFEGVASTPGVETLVKEYERGAFASALSDQKSFFQEYRKAGGGMSYSEFDEAVGKAARRGDVGDDEFVSRAAQSWRKKLADPLKDMAIEAGLLPKDVSVDTAMSYFSRVYNRPMLEALEPDFKAIVRRYIAQEVKNAEVRLEMSKVDPKVEAPKIEAPEFLNEADRQSYVNEIANDIFNTLAGKNADGDIPRHIVASRQGPLRERTFNIPDVEIENFLESSAEKVWGRYARTMASDVELTRTFGSADMKESIKAIQDDYTKLREQASANVDPKGEPLAKPLSQPEKEKRLRALAAREKSDLKDIEAVRDMIRGTYRRTENSNNFARVSRAAGTVNFMRTMGGMTLSSASDVARPIMVHGLTGVMQDGLAPLITNLKGFKLSVREARLAGAVTERMLNTRMASLAEILDPYSASSPFERLLANMANGFSRLTGMAVWNDFLKGFSSVITQNRILRNAGNMAKLGKRERAYMAYLGIDDAMAERIMRQFEKHGSEEAGGVRVAGTDDWDDEWARRVYRAAINRDVDSTIVTKGHGDVPLFMHTPIGQMAGQFKGFAIASHQRVLMRGLQERPAGVLSGVVFSTIMGMMVYAFKSIEANRSEELFDNPNPGRWIAEGLDRSGIFSIAFEVNNTVEKGLGIGAYGAFMSAFPWASQEGKASRYASRSGNLGALVTGPTGDLVDKTIGAINSLKDGNGWTEGEVNNIRNLLPYASLPGIRSIVDYAGLPAAKEALGAR